MSYYAVMGWVNLLLTFVVLAVVVWALISAATRPSRDFAYANTTKRFWVIALILCLLVSLNGVLYFIPLTFGFFLSLAAIVMPIYYLGPVQSRMPRKPRRPPRRPPQRSGGW
ncbi:MAG: DUF2516 family protein [Ancrocorticia sp.]|uniref:DUF2516 family protein n=1 Tax=Ancrocorticia sp. TaxID=2593684 RepID=UPI003F8EBB11